MRTRGHLINRAIIWFSLCGTLLLSNWPAQSQELRITSPVSNKPVSGDKHTVIGVGAKDGHEIKIRVKTDDWYRQTDCKVRLLSETKWDCFPVYLKGQGVYNNHTIEAEMIDRNGRVVGTATVEGIVRQ